jgi:hypothetical protein
MVDRETPIMKQEIFPLNYIYFSNNMFYSEDLSHKILSVEYVNPEFISSQGHNILSDSYKKSIPYLIQQR